LSVFILGGSCTVQFEQVDLADAAGFAGFPEVGGGETEKEKSFLPDVWQMTAMTRINLSSGMRSCSSHSHRQTLSSPQRRGGDLRGRSGDRYAEQ